MSWKRAEQDVPDAALTAQGCGQANVPHLESESTVETGSTAGHRLQLEAGEHEALCALP